jgi:hypothetical protein
MSLDKTLLDKMLLDETSLDEMMLDEMSLDKTTFDEMSLDKTTLDKMLLDEPASTCCLIGSCYKCYVTMNVSHTGLCLRGLTYICMYGLAKRNGEA